MSNILHEINRKAIDDFIEELFDGWKRGSCVFVCGNGGSASTASHFACDLNKCTAQLGRPRMKVFSLVDNVPLVSALTNDNGWSDVYVEQLENFFKPGDVLIAISVHGGSGSDRAGIWSQNLVKAVRYAKEHDGKSLAMAGFDGGVMKDLADVCIVVPYNTTPHVESFHVLLHHLVTFCLAEKIRSDVP